MKRLEKLTRKKLGEILVSEGLVTKSQLSDAEMEQRRTQQSLGTILVESSYLDEWDLAKIVASQYQLPFIQLGNISLGKEVGELFPLDSRVRHRFMPMESFGRVVTLAVAELPDLEFLESVEEETGLLPYLYVVLLSDIRSAFQKLGVEQGALATAAAPASGEKDEGMEVLNQLLSTDEPAFGPSRSDDDGEEKPQEIPELTADETWESIFDAADQSVMRDIDRD